MAEVYRLATRAGVAFYLALVLLLAALTQPLEARSRKKQGTTERGTKAVHVVERFSGKVVRVSDGDTCDVEIDSGKAVRVRIYGIDAPELSQPFGRDARKYLDQRIYRQEVTVEKFYDDQYGRCVGRILLNGQDLALELLREGIVWHYVQYCNDPSYAIAERLARNERKGLWRGNLEGGEPIAPWEYRKAHPVKKNEGTILGGGSLAMRARTIIPHSSFLIPHSSFLIPHSSFLIPHSSFPTILPGRFEQRNG